MPQKLTSGPHFGATLKVPRCSHAKPPAHFRSPATSQTKEAGGAARPGPPPEAAALSSAEGTRPSVHNTSLQPPSPLLSGVPAKSRSIVTSPPASEDSDPAPHFGPLRTPQRGPAPSRLPSGFR